MMLAGILTCVVLLAAVVAEIVTPIWDDLYDQRAPLQKWRAK